MLRKKFIDDGYVILNTKLNENPKFLGLCDQLYTSLDQNLKNSNIKKLRGYLMGNLNVFPGIYGDQLIELIDEEKILDSVEKIINIKLIDMNINYGGNLTLAGKGLQHFHMDGSFSKEMFLLSIATEDINEKNGPTEICVGSHKNNLPYWKFVFSKKNKKKILLTKGDIVIRKHSLWHKGTVNNSKKNRLLLSFLIFPKSSSYQIKLKETKGINISSNFFKENIFGYIQEFIYSKLRLFHFLLRIIKSFITNK